MFLSALEEHHVVKGTRLRNIFRQNTFNRVALQAMKKRTNKKATKAKQTKTTKIKTLPTPKTNHLRKINYAHVLWIIFTLLVPKNCYIWNRCILFPLCAACTYHGVHKEIRPSPRFSLDEVWRRSRRFHLEWVWQPDNFWGFDVIHISCSEEQNVNN